MKIPGFPPAVDRWDELPVETVRGASGEARIRRLETGSVMLRLVDYSKGYKADHWCAKGHLLHVLEGSIELVHKDGVKMVASEGMTYRVGDHSSEHQLLTDSGARCLIID